MYCMACKRETNGKENCCSICGKTLYQSKDNYDRFFHLYDGYSKKQLEEILNNPSDYQQDAYLVAKEIFEKKHFNFISEARIEWYYEKKGKRIGPISEQELAKKVDNDQLSNNTLVWKSGLDGWIPFSAANIQMSDKAKSNPPALPHNHVNNVFLWILIATPLLSEVAIYLFAGLCDIKLSDKMLGWIPFLLNSLCCGIDDHNLKKAGYSAVKGWFCFLIPIYIYKRMKSVQGNKWIVTVTWCIVLAISNLIPGIAWISIVGVSNPSVIEAVQSGNFYNNPSETVESVLENYLDRCTWETYVGKDRSVFVETSGRYAEHELVLVWKMNLDNSFQLDHFLCDEKRYENDKFDEMLSIL